MYANITAIIILCSPVFHFSVWSCDRVGIKWGYNETIFIIKAQVRQRLDACYWSSPFLFYNAWLTFLTTDYPMLITLTQTWSQFGLDRGTVEELHKIWWKIDVAPFLENIHFFFFLILVWNSWQTLREHNATTAAASPLPQTKCHTAFLCEYFWHATATREQPGQTFSTSLQKHTSNVKFQGLQSRSWSQNSTGNVWEVLTLCDWQPSASTKYAARVYYFPPTFDHAIKLQSVACSIEDADSASAMSALSRVSRYNGYSTMDFFFPSPSSGKSSNSTVHLISLCTVESIKPFYFISLLVMFLLLSLKLDFFFFF